MSFSPEPNPPIDLDPEAVEAIARRVAELIGSAEPVSRYLDTAGVAEMLGVSGEWVRDHAAELGAVRLGDGPRGALRFEVERVQAALERRRVGALPRKRVRPRRTTRAAGVRLLPLPEPMR